MKKLLKNVFAFLLVGVCVLITNAMPLQAADNALSDCVITFYLSDQTNGAFTGDVSVTMLNTDTQAEYTYSITNNDYVSHAPIMGCVKQGNYKIALRFDGKGTDYVICNEDGSEINEFAATADHYTFNWNIVSLVPETVSQEAVSDTTVSNTVSTTGNAEADVLYQNFLNAVAPIETDEQYSEILDLCDNTAVFFSKYYEQGTGRSADEYINMSSYERFLWKVTYIDAYNATHCGDYETYCGTVDKWFSCSVDVPCHLFETYGTDEMVQAYHDLMEFDYYYFVENGTIINFMDNQPLVSDEPTETVSESVTEPEPNATVTATATISSQEPQEQEDEPGIWDSTLQLLKDNIVTLIILLVVAGGTITIIIVRKRKNISDN